MCSSISHWFVTCLFVLILIFSTHCRTTFRMEQTQVATTVKPTTDYPLTRYERGLEDYDEEQESIRNGRAMYDHDHDHDHHDNHHDHITDMAPMSTEPPDMKEGRKSENWGFQYYDFWINEGSYKFWSGFQLMTAGLLIYSAFAAIYYAKFNLIEADYDYDYFSLRRSMDTPSSSPWFGISTQTFQNILDAISSKKYS